MFRAVYISFHGLEMAGHIYSTNRCLSKWIHTGRTSVYNRAISFAAWTVLKKSCWKFCVWDRNWTSEQARIEVQVYTLIVSPLDWHAFSRERRRERKWVSLLYPAPRLRVLILSVQFEVKKKNKFWKQANILPSLKLQVSLSVQLLLVQEVYLECDIRVTPNRACPLVIL
jgi:hypothetical protein